MTERNKRTASHEDKMRQAVARELVATARLLVASDEEDDDPKFIERVRGMKQDLVKLGPKKRKKLKQFDVDMLRPTNTVEDLVNALEQVVNG